MLVRTVDEDNVTRLEGVIVLESLEISVVLSACKEEVSRQVSCMRVDNT